MRNTKPIFIVLMCSMGCGAFGGSESGESGLSQLLGTDSEPPGPTDDPNEPGRSKDDGVDSGMDQKCESLVQEITACQESLEPECGAVAEAVDVCYTSASEVCRQTTGDCADQMCEPTEEQLTACNAAFEACKVDEDALWACASRCTELEEAFYVSCTPQGEPCDLALGELASCYEQQVECARWAETETDPAGDQSCWDLCTELERNAELSCSGGERPCDDPGHPGDGDNGYGDDGDMGKPSGEDPGSPREEGP